MIIGRPHDGESVFDVFATRARRRSRPSLVEQAVGSTLGALAIVLLASAWWPVAALLGASASYATWGVLERLPSSAALRVVLRAVATITVALSILAVTGIGLAAFTGDGPSPYGTCYDANGRAFACDARGQRRL